MKAAVKGALETVQELQNHGASVNVADKDGLILLRKEILDGLILIFRELLNRGAIVDTADKGALTPLIIALSECRVEFLLELLNHCAKVDITDAHGNTPLSAAASHISRVTDEFMRELFLRWEKQVYQVSLKNIKCVQSSFFEHSRPH